MARSTIVNLSVGLDKGGFDGTFREKRAKIKEVGVAVAEMHARFVEQDYVNKWGNVPGLLSRKQMARYHHKVFKQFNIPNDFYGGTWLGPVPDAIEFKLYGNLYCHDCDTDTGYR